MPNSGEQMREEGAAMGQSHDGIKHIGYEVAFVYVT